MVLLLWLYVKSKIRVYEYAAKVLVGLTFVSYLMDVYSVMFEHHSLDTIFLNSSFATSLFVGLATGAFALLMEYYHSFFSYGTPVEIQLLESFYAYRLRNHTLLYIYDGIQFVF